MSDSPLFTSLAILNQRANLSTLATGRVYRYVYLSFCFIVLCAHINYVRLIINSLLYEEMGLLEYLCLRYIMLYSFTELLCVI